jgi:hypothetical protein
MAEYCQNPLCHTNTTNDRLKKGKWKTRKVYSNSYHGYFCTLNCMNSFWNIFSERIINFIGKIETPFVLDKSIDINDIKETIRTRDYHQESNTRYHYITDSTLYSHLRETNQLVKE